MWDIVWVSPQGHRSVSVSRHFLLQAPQCPCSVRKRFSRDHYCRGRSKPGCRIVGSHTRLYLYRLLMSTGCKSSHSGFLDFSRSNGGLRTSGWIGQLSCFTDRLLHLVRREGEWAGPQPAQSPSRCTKCNSLSIKGQCTNFVLFEVAL